MQDDDPDIRRVVMAGMRQALPDARTEARVLAGLLARVSTPSVPDGLADGGGAPIASGAGLGATLKVIAGATIVGAAIIGTAVVATRPPEKAPTEAVTTEVRATASPPAIETPPARAPASPVAAPAPVPSPSVASPSIASPASAPPPSIARPPAPPTREPTPPPADGLAAETEILASAEAALATGDPARALELAATHAQRHPKGQLALERDAIATASACVAGRPGAAEAAARFVREHPQTAAAAKVRVRCEPPAKKGEGQ